MEARRLSAAIVDRRLFALRRAAGVRTSQLPSGLDPAEAVSLILNYTTA